MTGDIGPSRGDIEGYCIRKGCGVVESFEMQRRLGWVVTESRMQQSRKLGVRKLRMLRMQH